MANSQRQQEHLSYSGKGTEVSCCLLVVPNGQGTTLAVPSLSTVHICTGPGLPPLANHSFACTAHRGQQHAPSKLSRMLESAQRRGLLSSCWPGVPAHGPVAPLPLRKIMVAAFGAVPIIGYTLVPETRLPEPKVVVPAPFAVPVPFMPCLQGWSPGLAAGATTKQLVPGVEGLACSAGPHPLCGDFPRGGPRPPKGLTSLLLQRIHGRPHALSLSSLLVLGSLCIAGSCTTFPARHFWLWTLDSGSRCSRGTNNRHRGGPWPWCTRGCC